MPAKTIKVKTLDLKLDYANPRFIVPPAATQKDIRAYLFSNEEIVPLARGIAAYGGLMPGDRIIVIKEKDAYLVLEGNRRICACQCLLDPNLLPDSNKMIGFPVITPEIRAAIDELEADLLPNRKEAQRVLARRHIEGVRKWPPLAQAKFSTEHFNRGMSVKEVAELTDIPASKIKTHLQNYKLIQYAVNLPVWTSSEKDNLNIEKINIEVFIRIFRTRGAKQALKMDFDKQYQPISEFPKAVFDKAVELVARAAYIDKTIDTRTESYTLVPGLTNLLANAEAPAPDEQPSPPPPTKRPGSPDPSNSPGGSRGYNGPRPGGTGPRAEAGNTESPEPQNPNPEPPEKPKPTKVDPPRFFEELTWILDEKKDSERAVVLLADEIRRMSESKIGSKKLYYLFPINASLLLRSLIEQSFKYFLKKENHWGNVKKKSDDPTLRELLSHIQSNKKALFPDPTIARAFDAVFKNDGLKNLLDLIVHHTGTSRPTPAMLEIIANAGLAQVISHIINKQYTT